ncbi:Tat pathway signal sequence domain protein [Streptomyces sp. NPDC006872]|uniref:Tat pathway signal sequence domain protein n=1 Tax=Streptomyces sp. NPDC006872 TaxID=3155720 RepID=UPI0033F848D0
MSGVGPVEPGEGTRAWDTPQPPDPHRDPDSLDSPDAQSPTPFSRALARLTRFHSAHRRAVLAALAAALLLAGGGYLYATRPHDAEPAAPAPPFPSQTVDVSYLGEIAVPPGTRPRTFAFEVLLSVDSGPPVTLTRLAQPYAGLTLTSAPSAPFRTEEGAARKIVVTMHVTECGKAPRNVGLPFLDVTLRNARAIQDHSFILGPRYAHDLSEALQVACGNESA